MPEDDFCWWHWQGEELWTIDTWSCSSLRQNAVTVTLILYDCSKLLNVQRSTSTFTSTIFFWKSCLLSLYKFQSSLDAICTLLNTCGPNFLLSDVGLHTGTSKSIIIYCPINITINRTWGANGYSKIQIFTHCSFFSTILCLLLAKVHSNPSFYSVSRMPNQ